MRAEAVVYVGDLERMRAFYAACFELTDQDDGDGFCTLQSPAWMLTMVRSAEAEPVANPAPRRSQTPIKLAFGVDSIEAVRSAAPALGGHVEPAATEWTFREAIRCDCVDPEGNVVQLVEAKAGVSAPS